jgi:hypothetical protein
MFESRHHPLLPVHLFAFRFLMVALVAAAALAASLFLGAFGYRYTEGWSWLDATLNAAMILGGMGPVNVVQTEAGKVFATFYALFSGVAFLTIMSILLAPFFHRFLHRFHLEVDEES